MQNTNADLDYGLHIVLPQPVEPPPPSALGRLGVTKVLRKSTAAPKTSSIGFTVLLSLLTAGFGRRYFHGAAPAATARKNVRFVRNS